MMKRIDLHVGLATEGSYCGLAALGGKKLFVFRGGLVGRCDSVVFGTPCTILVSNTLLASGLVASPPCKNKIFT